MLPATTKRITPTDVGSRREGFLTVTVTVSSEMEEFRPRPRPMRAVDAIALTLQLPWTPWLCTATCYVVVREKMTSETAHRACFSFSQSQSSHMNTIQIQYTVNRVNFIFHQRSQPTADSQTDQSINQSEYEVFLPVSPFRASLVFCKRGISTLSQVDTTRGCH